MIKPFIALGDAKEHWMKIGAWLLLGTCIIAAGCTGSTAVSTQPTQTEIDAGIQRRLADVEKMQIPEEQKERMRAQIRGSQAKR